MIKINLQLEISKKQKVSKKLTLGIAFLSFTTLLASLIFTLILDIHVGRNTANTLRFYTYQSNILIFISYFLMALGYYFKKFERIKDNRRFRFLINTWISLTLWMVVFILGPLQFADEVFGLGPGAFGDPSPPIYEGFYETLALINNQWSNLFFHGLIPIGVLVHYWYDRKWLNKDWYISHRSIWFAMIYPFFYFISTFSFYFYDNWAPYSIMNPEMWHGGWFTVMGWIFAGITIYFVYQYIYKYFDNKVIKRI